MSVDPCWCCEREYHALCDRYMRKGLIEECGCDHEDVAQNDSTG